MGNLAELSLSLDLATIVNTALTVAVIAPGVIIIATRSVFLDGRKQSVSGAIIEYLITSSIYFAFAVPLFLETAVLTWWSAIAFLIVIPLVVGLVWGFASQRSFLKRFFARFGVGVVSDLATAWDAMFVQLRSGVWVVVTLKDGRRFWGFMGGRSHASQDATNRDIFIERLTDHNWQSVEPNGRNRGIWIAGDQIAIMEMIED